MVESKHLHQFIEKYAKFSRLPNPLIAPVNMERFINSLEQICDIKIEIENLATEARFDAGQLEQVIINLVKNARESGGDTKNITVNMT